MGGRPRHPRKELEAILRRAESLDWRVEKRGQYFKMKCPCPDRHLKTVRLTPDKSHYEKNLIHVLVRDTCWKERT